MNRLDPETAALLRRLRELGGGGPRPDMRELPVAAVRTASRATWMALAGTDRSACRVEPLALPGPGGPIPARLYRPAGRAGALPLVVYFHGGGWVMGDLDSYEPLVKALCQASGAAFVSVDYRLAPENRFPAGLEDARAALAWAATEADRVGCDRDRIGVMGDSAGGNLAAVVALAERGSNPTRVRAQFLIYPMLDVASGHDRYSSRRDYGDGEYLLANSDIDAVTAWYLNDTPPGDPRVSPLFEPDLAGAPPAVIVSAGLDPLTGEAERYAERLTGAGVACRHRSFDNTIHAFMSFGDLAVARRARQWLGARVCELLA